MSRPSFHDIYMRLACLMSERSTCLRTNSAGELMKVGAAIVSADFRQVYAIGYNGNASGLPNRCDSNEPGKCGCIHAETNAIVSCSAPRDESKVVFCTHLPCTACAKLIIQLGGRHEIEKRAFRIRIGDHNRGIDLRPVFEHDACCATRSDRHLLHS